MGLGGGSEEQLSTCCNHIDNNNLPSIQQPFASISGVYA